MAPKHLHSMVSINSFGLSFRFCRVTFPSVFSHLLFPLLEGSCHRPFLTTLQFYLLNPCSFSDRRVNVTSCGTSWLTRITRQSPWYAVLSAFPLKATISACDVCSFACSVCLPFLTNSELSEGFICLDVCFIFIISSTVLGIQKVFPDHIYQWSVQENPTGSCYIKHTFAEAWTLMLCYSQTCIIKVL